MSFKLANSTATAYIVPEEYTVGMKAMIVADAHFDKTLTLTKALPKYIRSITNIILRQGVNTLFVLGDTIHNDDDMTLQKLEMIIHGYEQIPIPVFIIGGNHDRGLLWELQYNKIGSNVQIVYDLAICIKHPNPPPGTAPRVFLAHDMKNNYHVPIEKAEQFVIALKEGLTDLIKPEDFLVIGHTHTHVINAAKRCATVGAYSEDNHRTSYAILTTEGGFDIKFTGK